MLPPLNASQLIQKYCPALQPGNPEITMRNHNAQALIDGPAYFRAVEQEITALLASKQPGRFFFMSAWWLGLVANNTPLNLPGYNPILTLPGSPRLSQVTSLPGMTKVRDLLDGLVGPWSYPPGGGNLLLNNITLPSGQTLYNRVIQMKNQGINVRVIAWVGPLLTKVKPLAETAGGVAECNWHTLLSANALRAQIGNENVLLNMLAHTFGGAHLKMFVCGEHNRMAAFVSGIDPQDGRMNAPARGTPGPAWHDVGVRVEGTAAGDVYNFFRSLWNEQLARPVETFTINGNNIPSHDPAWPPLIARETVNSQTQPANQYVQMLRTVPRMNFNRASAKRRGKLLLPGESPLFQFGMGTVVNYIDGFRRKPLSFGPDGIFEFKRALEKAISAAENYIFIADQGFWGLEIMGWINARMKQKPNLKVILIYGADPADPPSSILAEALQGYLAPGLPQQPGTEEPANAVFYTWQAITVHSKVTIIDDVWCAIGSANCMRRSLYTDIELSVGILEPPTPANMLPDDGDEEANPGLAHKQAPSFVQQFRRDLWAYYCDLTSNHAITRDLRAEFLNLEMALKIWKPSWGSVPLPMGISLRGDIVKTPIAKHPYPTEEVTDPNTGNVVGVRPIPFSTSEYDLMDTDSRQNF